MVPVHPIFKRKQIIRRRKNRRRQRIPQIGCVRKEARIILIDVKVANFDTEFMRRRGESSIVSQIFRTRHRMTKLLRATTKNTCKRWRERQHHGATVKKVIVR